MTARDSRSAFSGEPLRLIDELAILALLTGVLLDLAPLDPDLALCELARALVTLTHSRRHRARAGEEPRQARERVKQSAITYGHAHHQAEVRGQSVEIRPGKYCCPRNPFDSPTR